jgi:hypothetical protein
VQRCSSSNVTGTATLRNNVQAAMLLEQQKKKKNPKP